PVEDGEVPDAAGMIGAIEGVTGKEVELIAGKPSELMVKAALDRLDVQPEKCLLIGDRLETDIKMGNDHGIPTALVLTGVTSREDLAGSSIEPTCVLDNLYQLPEELDLGLELFR
ncbi:MAG: HAD hydrolase-like protein, partial [Candidatus Bipolaricaulota bacterium]